MTSPEKKTAVKPKPRLGGASEVAPGVFVGGVRDAAEFEGARICVRDEDEEAVPTSTHLPVYDGRTDRALRTNLEEIARAIDRERAAGRPVLVYCGHGVRRSPLAAAWYLHRTEGLPLAAAYARIRGVRPQIEEASEWVGDTTGLE